MRDGTPRNRRGLLTILIAMCLLVAGCGGDDAGSTTAAESPTSTAAATTTEPEPAATTTPPTITTSTPPTTAAPTSEPTPEPIAMGIAIAPGTAEATQTALAAGADRATADFGAEVTFHWPEELAAGLRELAAGNALVLAVGFGFEDALAEVAAEFPGVVFVRVDGAVGGPNVVSTRIAINEAAFIAGAAAARLMHHAHLVATTGDSIRLTQATGGKGVTPLTT